MVFPPPGFARGGWERFRSTTDFCFTPRLDSLHSTDVQLGSQTMKVNECNVASHLARMAVEQPERIGIVEARRNKQLTFRDLQLDSDRLAHGLEGIGIRRGMRTALMVPPSIDFFLLTFALFKIGAVPILIDPGMGIRNLGRCLADAQPEAFIGLSKANLARRVLRWARSTIRITVTTGRSFAKHSFKRLRNFNTNLPYPIAYALPDETAAILFTSGSTGIAKGVVYTHGVFSSQIDSLRRMYDIRPGEVDLSTFPLFALFAPALGMTAIIPDMDFTRPGAVDPKMIIAAIEKFGVTNLFGSPALINRVGRFGAERKIKLPTLQRVISAGAPVPATVVERFTRMLEHGAQLHTPYGATEALPVSSIGSNELLNETRRLTDLGCGVCVGHPVAGMEVRIVAISDAPMLYWNEEYVAGNGTIGEITVSGPVVTTSYFNRPVATEQAKIMEWASGRIWHRMGDLGYVDSKGRLWFCGRKTQRVMTSRGTLFTIPCEAIFNTHPAVFRSALVGIPAYADLQPVICIELDPTEFRPKLNQLEGELLALAQSHQHTKAITTVLFHPAFPVDIRHNSKIFREKLAVWAAKMLKNRHWSGALAPITAPPLYDSIAVSEHSSSSL